MGANALAPPGVRPRSQPTRKAPERVPAQLSRRLREPVAEAPRGGRRPTQGRRGESRTREGEHREAAVLELGHLKPHASRLVVAEVERVEAEVAGLARSVREPASARGGERWVMHSETGKMVCARALSSLPVA